MTSSVCTKKDYNANSARRQTHNKDIFPDGLQKREEPSKKCKTRKIDEKYTYEIFENLGGIRIPLSL